MDNLVFGWFICCIGVTVCLIQLDNSNKINKLEAELKEIKHRLEIVEK